MKHAILLIILLSTISTSCERNELCYEKGVSIQVIIKWDLTNIEHSQLPENMHLLFFPSEGGNLILDFVETRGGVIQLEQGNYSVLTFNDNTEHIFFRGKSYSTFEAYVGQITRKRLDQKRAGEVLIDQPDSLYVAATDHFNVYPSPRILVLEKSPVSRVRRIPFTFRSITGIRYLSGIEISIDNLAQAVVLHSGELSEQTGTVIPRYHISGDSITGDFATLGHYYSPLIKHTFTISFLYGGGVVVRHYDVTAMMDTYERIDITDNIVFDPIEGSEGFAPGVGAWENEDVTLD